MYTKVKSNPNAKQYWIIIINKTILNWIIIIKKWCNCEQKMIDVKLKQENPQYTELQGGLPPCPSPGLCLPWPPVNFFRPLTMCKLNLEHKSDIMTKCLEKHLIIIEFKKIIFQIFYVFFIFQECHWKPEWAHNLSICNILYVILKIGLFQYSKCDGTPFLASSCVLHEIVEIPKKHFHHATLPRVGSGSNFILFVFMKTFVRATENVPIVQ